MVRFAGIICGLILCVMVPSSGAQAEWYDGGWAYRQVIQVTNGGNVALTGYATAVALRAPSFDFSHAALDGADLRFTDSDGVTPISFWIQDYSAASGQAKVWVRIPYLAPNAERDLYVYVGNPSALPASDGASTFPAFAGFDEDFTVTARVGTEDLLKIACAPETPTPLISPGAPGEIDHWGFREHGNVLYEPNEPDPARRYKTWYSILGDSAYTSDRLSWLGQAISPDGYSWTKLGRVSTTIHGEDPYVVHIGGTYRLFYEGKTDPQWDNVSMMTSPDGITWTYYGIIIPPNPNYDWMDRSPSSPTTWAEVSGADTNWYCFFEGKGTGPNRGGGSIGLATSSDGFNWTVYGPDPIIPLGNPGEWDSDAMVPDCIYREDGRYWLIYHGHNSNPTFHAGFAYSYDLYHWTKIPAISGSAAISQWEDPQVFWDADGQLTSTVCGQTRKISRAYLYHRDPTQWPYGPTWSLETRGGSYGLANASGGFLHLSGEAFNRSSTSMVSTQRWTRGFEVQMRARSHDYGSTVYSSVAIGSGNLEDMNLGGQNQWEVTVLQSGYAVWFQNVGWAARMPQTGGKINLAQFPFGNLPANYTVRRLVYDNSDFLRWYVSDTLRVNVRDTTFAGDQKKVLISQGEYPDGSGGIEDIDWVFVRTVADEEPVSVVGPEQAACFTQVVSPSGGETVVLGDPINVQWTGGAPGNPIRIELNRDYPTGPWEILADSAVNDGIETFILSGNPSSACRIRTTCLPWGPPDVSDANFVLTDPQQILALPGTLGVVNGCDADFQLYLMGTLQNIFSFRLQYVYNPSLVEFLGTQSMPNSGLTGIQTAVFGDTIELSGAFGATYSGADTLVGVTFHVLAEADTATIFTFIAGQGRDGSQDTSYDVPLTGSYSTLDIAGAAPLSPAQVVVQTVGGPAKNDSLRLYWTPVTQDVEGGDVNAPRYSVYFRQLSDSLVYLIGSTTDTTLADTYSHGLNLDPMACGEYWVRVCRTQP